ncbi:MAG: EamA family transporter [Chloroflexi bacterium HGW-Chloroflexi-10]|nr:MAG: EamA family transporter [Chloroflexi bacterium HGW-Chloroflexi-10]
MGEIAALLTALCWTGTSLFFSSAGMLVGSKTVNRTRLLMAVVFLSLTHLFVTGSLIPLHAEGFRWLWLGLSAIAGLVIGDALLFQAFVMIGARVAMLVMAIVPAISAILAWLFLGENLGIWAILGMALTMSGIVLVILDQQRDKTQFNSDESRKRLWMGILFTLGGALGQAGGLILAKKGLTGDFPALSGVLMRMIVAMIAIWLLTFIQGETRQNFQRLKEQPKAVRLIIGGAIFGPFIGVWLSLIAVQFSKVGIASTLMSLTPILHLPIVALWLKERINARAIIGTVIAMIGVAVIFLKP